MTLRTARAPSSLPMWTSCATGRRRRPLTTAVSWALRSVTRAGDPSTSRLVLCEDSSCLRHRSNSYCWLWVCCRARVDRNPPLQWLAILVYPVGYLLFVASLLLAARKAILLKKPTRLSRALAFLYREYEKSFYFWEVGVSRWRFRLSIYICACVYM